MPSADRPVRIAGHSFVRFDYDSPVAGLHWHVLATQIRCHMVQFVFTSRDTKLLENSSRTPNKIKLPDEAGIDGRDGRRRCPVCVRDYARAENIVEKVDPIPQDHKYNPIPVRVIIDQEGKVKHIHFLSAFPDQAKASPMPCCNGNSNRTCVTASRWRWRPGSCSGTQAPQAGHAGPLTARASRLPISGDPSPQFVPRADTPCAYR